MKIFCERLKEVREEKGISINKLAKEIGVDHSTIVRWEKGDRVSTIDNLYLVAKFFNVSSDYLIGLSDDVY